MQEFYSRFKLPDTTAKFVNDAPNRASFLFARNFPLLICDLHCFRKKYQSLFESNKDEM